MIDMRIISSLVSLVVTITVSFGQNDAWEYDRTADAGALPEVPEGFEISFFAREPLVRQPCSMAFDAKGRLCVGMGPQYRSPDPDTPGDSVVLVLDQDGNGRADETRVFATGFNCIQGLAWHGDELWVANAPDLTVVRDLDGDDVADEYIRLYTDLGNLEHGLHGLTWAPDGRLYMSKGNSKGLNQPGRYAPKAFRDLWGMSAPANTPDFPDPVRFTAQNYQKNYHDPRDDWGREGGTLRCEADGSHLEYPLKDPAHVALVIETRFDRDLSNAFLRGVQQLLRHLDPQFVQVLARRHPQELAKAEVELSTRKAGHARHLLHGQVRLEIFLDIGDYRGELAKVGLPVRRRFNRVHHPHSALNSPLFIAKRRLGRDVPFRKSVYMGHQPNLVGNNDPAVHYSLILGVVGLRQGWRLEIKVGLANDFLQGMQIEYIPQNQLIDIDIAMLPVLGVEVGSGMMLEKLEEGSQHGRGP